MKNTFVKKALLASVVALALQTVPVSAMAMNNQVQTMVRTEEAKLKGLSQEEVQKTLDTDMKKLNPLWKRMMRCISKPTGCTRNEAAAVLASLAAIIAALRVLGAQTGIAPWTKAEMTVGGALKEGMNKWKNEGAEAAARLKKGAATGYAKGAAARETATSFTRRQAEALKKKVTPGVSRSYVTEPAAYK